MLENLRKETWSRYNKIKLWISNLLGRIKDKNNRCLVKNRNLNGSEWGLPFCSVRCLSPRLLLMPCPRLICLEQSSLRICTKEQRVWSPSRKLLNTCPLSIKSKGSGMSVKANFNFHFPGSAFRRNEEKNKGRWALQGSSKAVAETRKLAAKACHWVTKDSETSLLLPLLFRPFTA